MTLRPPPPPRPVIVSIGWRANVGEFRTVCTSGSLGGPGFFDAEGDSSVRLWWGTSFGGSVWSCAWDCGELGPRLEVLGILTGRGIVFPETDRALW